MREMVDRDMIGRELAQRRRTAVARRSHGTGLEYGLIAAALAVAIVTVVVGVGTRYGASAGAASPAAISSEMSR